jgi:integrase
VTKSDHLIDTWKVLVPEAFNGGDAVPLEEMKPAPRFSEFAWGRYWETMQAQHAAKPKTMKYHRTGLRMLSRYAPLQNMRLDKINADSVDELIAWCRKQKAQNKKTTLSVAAINRTLEVLRHMLLLAEKWDTIRKAPRISRLPGENARDRILTHEEETLYLAAVESSDLRDVFTCILDQGWRPEEIFRARWERTKLDPVGTARYGHLFNDHGKSKNSRRAVPMTARANALMRWRWESQGKPNEGWCFPRPTKSGHIESLDDEHAAALAKAGLPHFVIYAARHTFLTRLGEAGADQGAIMKMGGHSDARIAARYNHPTDEKTQTAFDRLENYNAQQMKKVEAERKKEQVQ